MSHSGRWYFVSLQTLYKYIIHGVAHRISNEILAARNSNSTYLRKKNKLARIINKTQYWCSQTGKHGHQTGYGSTIYATYAVNSRIAKREYSPSKGRASRQVWYIQRQKTRRTHNRAGRSRQHWTMLKEVVDPVQRNVRTDQPNRDSQGAKDNVFLFDLVVCGAKYSTLLLRNNFQDKYGSLQ